MHDNRHIAAQADAIGHIEWDDEAGDLLRLVQADMRATFGRHGNRDAFHRFPIFKIKIEADFGVIHSRVEHADGFVILVDGVGIGRLCQVGIRNEPS